MPGAKVQWRLESDVGGDRIPELLIEFADFLDEHEPGVVICDVRVVQRPSKSTLDALTRLALLAKRRQSRLILTQIGPRLWTLLRLTGLDKVLTLGSRARPGAGRARDPKPR